MLSKLLRMAGLPSQKRQNVRQWRRDIIFNGFMLLRDGLSLDQGIEAAGDMLASVAMIGQPVECRRNEFDDIIFGMIELWGDNFLILDGRVTPPPVSLRVALSTIIRIGDNGFLNKLPPVAQKFIHLTFAQIRLE